MNEISRPPPSGFRVAQAMGTWASARARLLAEDPDLEGDETALANLLGNEEGDVDSILGRLIRAVRHAKAQAETLGGMIDEMQTRKARYTDRANAMRGTALAICEAMEWEKREYPDFTVSVTPGALSVDVKDPDAIPDIYVETVRKADKATILSVLKSGEGVPGAELVRGLPSLRVRTR